MHRKLREVVAGQTVVSASASTTVRAAAVTMAQKNIGAVVIVDSFGKLIDSPEFESYPE